MVDEFRARRDLIVDGLNAIPGIRCLLPQRRVLRVPERRRHGHGRAPSSRDLLLHEAGVSVLSGTAFGTVGSNHIRLSYATSRAHISRAIEKMRDVLEPVAAGR